MSGNGLLRRAATGLLVALTVLLFLPSPALACTITYQNGEPSPGGCGGAAPAIGAAALLTTAAGAAVVWSLLSYARGAMSATDMVRALQQNFNVLDAIGRDLPSGGQSIGDRLAAGAQVPARARGNPDSYYYNPQRREYQLKPTDRGANPVSGSTIANQLGTRVHSKLKAADIASGRWDQVDTVLTDAAGDVIMLPKRYDLTTGEPMPDSPLMKSRPDGLSLTRDEIMDHKPIGRPVLKDQHQIIRYVKAYELKTGRLPQKILIEAYDPLTGAVVDTQEYSIQHFMPWLNRA